MAGEVVEQIFTEAELTGEDVTPPVVTPDPAVTPVVPSVVPPVVVTPVVTPVKEGEADPGKVTPPPVVTPEKKDDRTVPLAALHEERARNRQLRERLEALERTKAEVVKSPEELMLEGDADGAVASLTQQIAELRAELDRRDIKHSIDLEVPDFLDKAPLMEELLLNNGISEDSVLNIIGASGKDAPKLFKILSKLVDAPDATKLRTAIEAELRPKIVAEETTRITKELMEKFKITEPAKSLNTIPGTVPDGKLKVNTEAEYEKLTPEQREAWLNG